MEVLDFLAAFPGRAFTLSEIARAAKINVASCHAVLNALVSRGYLSRSANEKTYSLGPALVAIGHSALKSQPLILRAQDAARELSRELALPVMLTSLVGDEILAVDCVKSPSGKSPSMRVGQRMPLVPPVGSSFLAWSSETAIEAWITRMAPPGDSKFVEDWRQDLALIRKRGYQVTLRTPNSANIASIMANIASSRKAPDFRSHMIDMIHATDERLFHPKSIESKENYLVALIGAPIFDQKGEAAFCLCLVEFPEKISGAKIKVYSDRLVHACLHVMRNDRAA
jgi:DNA-binding IclR family transcriptional regulator